jgi:hypothetical protein
MQIDLIGDSHIDPERSIVEMSKNNINFKNVNVYVVQGKSAFSVDYSTISYEKRKNSIVVVGFGYIDCKVYSDHKFIGGSDSELRFLSADEVAKKYVDKTINFFYDSKIVFLEPFPQFKEIYDSHKFSPFLTRHKRHKELSKSIEKYAIMNNKQYISLSNYFKNDWLEKPFSQDDHISVQDTIKKTEYIFKNIQ